MTTFSVKRLQRYPVGSVTPAGAVRNWRITERRYWGHGVPRMAPAGWLAPSGVSECAPTIISEWHTERHALNVLNSLEREHDRLWKLTNRERKSRRTGEIFTHPSAVSLYRSTDQSCAVGGSRSGLEPLWHRVTLVTETRDGVKYTDDITIERDAFTWTDVVNRASS